MPEPDVFNLGGGSEVMTVETADARIANMLKRLEQTGKDLETLFKPLEAQETPQGILAMLGSALDRLTEAIGDFFK